MRQPNLDLTTQTILLSALVLLAGVALVRVTVFFRRQCARIPPGYPDTWTSDQTKVFEQVRTSIGVALVITWAILELAEPRMPQAWPFGFQETILTLGLLLLTNAWLLLLIPSNWGNTIIGRVSFGTTTGILVWWWGTLLGAVLVAIAIAARPIQVALPFGTYAHYHNSLPKPAQVAFVASDTAMTSLV